MTDKEQITNNFAKDINVPSKEQINDSLKNLDKNFNEKFNNEKELIAIQCTNYTLETKSCSKSLSGSCCGEMCQTFNLLKQLARKTQECEELKKQLMQKDEVNTFFNTPIEGWSSNPCDICENKNNYEQLTQECEQYKKRAVCFKDVNKQLGYKYLTIKQECEELKKQLMQKSEVDTFFNTPIEGWSNDPCGICPHKAENEELKKEIINKNEKIKELRFSVSDLTNRLCYLNAEKSFRIVDLEQALDEIEKELKEDIYCENQECGCDDFEECLKCTKEHILDIINKAKGGQ